MRYCGIFDPVKLGRITLKQYMLMTRAMMLRLEDKERDLHVQAWLNQQVKATKQQGKKTLPYFRSFDEFYQSEQQKDTPENKQKTAEQEHLKLLMLKANTK